MTATRTSRIPNSQSSGFGQSSRRLSWLSWVLLLMATWVSLGFLLGGLASSARFLLGIAKQPQWPTLGSAALLLIVAVAGCAWCAKSTRILSDTKFLALVAGLWVVSRCAVVFLFRNYVLVGDEYFLHQFVVAMAKGGLNHLNLGQLSNSYDFPIWLSRALPIYYPLRVVFGSNDLVAVRILNTVMGAGTLAFTFFIAKRVTSARMARVAAWLLLIFPYHVFDVLGCEPEIPGTLLFTAGIWLLLRLMDERSYSSKVIAEALLLGFLMALMGVVRGGLDLLLVVVAAVLVLCSRRWGNNRRSAKAACLLALVAMAVWLPARYAVSRWVASYDLYHLRSQALGFLTRGSNPVSMGEYLLRYEELDAATPPVEKSRVLLSVLMTETRREPLVTLFAVPVAKLVKVFLPGYSASFERGLEMGGYNRATLAATGARLAFAPVLLIMGFIGALPASYRVWVVVRYRVPIVTVATASGALVLLWEASPRYSHCAHFALVILAAAGFAQLERREFWRAPRLNRQAISRVATSTAGLFLIWAKPAAARITSAK